MSLFELIKQKIQELVGPPNPPDPQEQLRQLFNRLQGELREAKIRAADMIREEKRIRSERDEYRYTAHQADEAALGSMNVGNEAAARRHLERKLHAQEVADQLEEQRAAIETQVNSLREAIETYRLETERIEREQRTWEMRQRTARLRSDIHKDVSSSALSEARTLIRSSQDNALHEEARAEVRDNVSRARQWEKVRRARGNPQIEEELDRLRNRIGTSE